MYIAGSRFTTRSWAAAVCRGIQAVILVLFSQENTVLSWERPMDLPSRQSPEATNLMVSDLLPGNEISAGFLEYVYTLVRYWPSTPAKGGHQNACAHNANIHRYGDIPKYGTSNVK